MFVLGIWCFGSDRLKSVLVFVFRAWIFGSMNLRAFIAIKVSVLIVSLLLFNLAMCLVIVFIWIVIVSLIELITVKVVGYTDFLDRFKIFSFCSATYWIISLVYYWVSLNDRKSKFLIGEFLGLIGLVLMKVSTRAPPLWTL